MNRSIWALSIVFGLASASALWSAREPSETTEEALGERGFLGIQRSYEEQAGQGRLRVHAVVAGGPAEQAGLRKDDLIVAVNNITFRFKTTLEQYDAFSWVKPGDQVELKVLRGDSTLNLVLTAAITPPNVALRAAQIRLDERRGRQHQILMLLGQGDGIEILVARDAKTGSLEFSAPGQQTELLADLELYLEQFPTLSELMARLEPGDRFEIRFSSDGKRIDMKVVDLPLYLDPEAE